MSEYVIDHPRASYSESHPNPTERDIERHEYPVNEEPNDRVMHAGDIQEDNSRWSEHLNTRVPSRPPGELRSVDE